jgi:Family of unknown function (DUF6159)
MGSISRGFRLAKASWSVVRQDRELLILPVVSFFCSLVVMLIFGLGALGIGLPQQGEQPNPALYVLAFVMYVLLAFVSIFFNAAVIGTAMKRLEGEEATLRDGLDLARRHLGKIFMWAVVTATVGMLIRALQERSGLIGRIILGIVGIAWTVLTFFVVPVLLYEDAGVGDAIKRSGSIFRQRWGEQFIGTGTIGLAVFLIAIPVIVIGGLITAAMPALGIPLLVLAIGVLMAIGAACTGVFNAALYRYATTGEASGAFTLEDMNGSFRPRRGLGGGSTPAAPGGFTGAGFGGGNGPAQGSGGTGVPGPTGGTSTGVPPPPSAPERPDA